MMTADVAVTRAQLSKSTEVIETSLPGELILLDASSGEMYSLNQTGCFVWERLDVLPLDQIAVQLAESFGIGRSQAEADVGAFVSDLVRTGIVERKRESTT